MSVTSPVLWMGAVIAVVFIVVGSGCMLAELKKPPQPHKQRFVPQPQWCSECQKWTTEVLIQCWYHKRDADMLAPICSLCRARYHATPMGRTEGDMDYGPAIIELPIYSRKIPPPLKW